MILSPWSEALPFSPLGICPALTRAPILHREGTGEETGGEIWDPLDIAGSVSDEALMWFRAAELKHGRAAMVRDPPTSQTCGRRHAFCGCGADASGRQPPALVAGVCALARPLCLAHVPHAQLHRAGRFHIHTARR